MSGRPAGRALVLRPGAIGDTLLALPALAAMRRHFPELAIEVAANPVALPAVAAAGLADRWLAFDDARVTRLFLAGPVGPDDPFQPLAVAVAWSGDPDGVLRQALAARGAAPVVVAPSRPAAGAGLHVARHLLATLAPLGIDPAGPLDWPPIHPPAEAMRAADAELAALGLAGRPFVALHPGSGSAAKNWPAARFAEVADRLRREHELAVLALGGPAEGEVLARLQASAEQPLPVLVDRPLLVVASVLERARAYLGNDSGLSHLAGLLGRPTLALFGPTDPVLWAPLGPRVRVLRHRPLEELLVGTVVEALTELLAAGP